MKNSEAETWEVNLIGVLTVAGLNHLASQSEAVALGLINLQTEAIAARATLDGNSSTGEYLGSNEPLDFSDAMSVLLQAIRLASARKTTEARVKILVEATFKAVALLAPEKFAASENNADWRAGLELVAREFISAFEIEHAKRAQSKLA